MLARSVAERRLEFATLRAIGVPRRTILFTVGAEAVLISLAAGLIGIVLSLFLGALLNAAMAAAYGLEGIYRADAGLFILVFVLAISWAWDRACSRPARPPGSTRWTSCERPEDASPGRCTPCSS